VAVASLCCPSATSGTSSPDCVSTIVPRKYEYLLLLRSLEKILESSSNLLFLPGVTPSWFSCTAKWPRGKRCPYSDVGEVDSAPYFLSL